MVAPSLEGHHLGHNRLGAVSVVPCCCLVPPTALLGIAGGPVALIGGPLALVGTVVAFISGPLALVGEMVALVGGPLPLVEVVPGPVQRGGASGQPGLGGLQRLLGRPGPRPGRLDPSVIDGHGRDPLALSRLDHLLGEVGQFPRRRPRRLRSCWNAWSGPTPPGRPRKAL